MASLGSFSKDVCGKALDMYKLHCAWLLYTGTVGWGAKNMGGKKPQNYSDSGRKSLMLRIFHREMLSLDLISAVIRYGLCHRDPGAGSGALSSADALLEKSKSLRKSVSSACESGSAVIEQSVQSLERNIYPPGKIYALLQLKVQLFPAFSQEVLVSLLILDLFLQEKFTVFSHFLSYFSVLYLCNSPNFFQLFDPFFFMYGHQSIFQ